MSENSCLFIVLHKQLQPEVNALGRPSRSLADSIVAALEEMAKYIQEFFRVFLEGILKFLEDAPHGSLRYGKNS